jgi:hypothetical protein
MKLGELCGIGRAPRRRFRSEGLGSVRGSTTGESILARPYIQPARRCHTQAARPGRVGWHSPSSPTESRSDRLPRAFKGSEFGLDRRLGGPAAANGPCAPALWFDGEPTRFAGHGSYALRPVSRTAALPFSWRQQLPSPATLRQWTQCRKSLRLSVPIRDRASDLPVPLVVAPPFPAAPRSSFTNSR